MSVARESGAPSRMRQTAETTNFKSTQVQGLPHAGLQAVAYGHNGHFQYVGLKRCELQQWGMARLLYPNAMKKFLVPRHLPGMEKFEW